MEDVMTAPASRELVDVLRRRYAAATREDKVRILPKFAAVGMGDKDGGGAHKGIGDTRGMA